VNFADEKSAPYDAAFRKNSSTTCLFVIADGFAAARDA